MTGQGLAIAEALAKDGAHVAVGSYVGAGGRSNDAAAYPEEDAVGMVLDRLKSIGGRAFAGHLDVRNSAVIEAFIREATGECGPFDILVNAAGTTAEQPVCGHSD